MLRTKSKHSLKGLIIVKSIFFITYFAWQRTDIICALEAPTVHLPSQGVMVGLYMKMFRTQNIKAYLGIQYAKAPRFAPPEIRVNKWNMIYNATSYGPKCWQKNIGQTNKQTMQIQELLMTSNTKGGTLRDAFDEECLYLNIFIPDGKMMLTFRHTCAHYVHMYIHINT